MSALLQLLVIVIYTAVAIATSWRFERSIWHYGWPQALASTFWPVFWPLYGLALVARRIYWWRQDRRLPRARVVVRSENEPRP